jgi:hypothetical protein
MKALWPMTTIQRLLQRLWLSREWTPTDTFNLYVDSPFCAQSCAFCMLNSSQVSRDNRDVMGAYHRALVAELEDWRPVLTSRPLDTVYFGGGTPSLMSVEAMGAVFAAIPGFAEIGGKCFECDPLSLTLEKIDLLAEQRFAYITFGVQTLDRAELRRQRRVNPGVERLTALTEYALGRGLYVSYDIMAFLDDDAAADLRRIEADLRTILEHMRPTAVDIYPMSPNLDRDPTVAVRRVMQLRRLLGELRGAYPGWNLADEANVLAATEVRFEDRYRNYFLLRHDPAEYFARVKRYSCSDVLSAPASQNTLGFGGFGPREVYSYLDAKSIAYRSRYDPQTDAFTYY